MKTQSLLLTAALSVCINLGAHASEEKPILLAQSESVTPTHEHNKVVMQGKTHDERETAEPSSEVSATHDHNKVSMKGKSHDERETTEPSSDVDPTHQHNKVTMPGEKHNP